MIITKLQGGLGNQLFQWAISKSLSIDYNTDFYFDLSYFISNTPKGVSKRELDINKINNIKINEYKEKEKNIKYLRDNFTIKKINNNTYLDGYWQSEKYFKHNENIIKNELNINVVNKNYILNKYKFLNEDTLSIHVRRGDYLNLKDKHPIQSLDYYNNGYDYINDNNINVVVLSDDIDWCKKNLKYNNIYFIENEINIIDLYIMSLSSHNIISNSTFSWWGSWLNNNKNKKIIAPKKWFGDKLPNNNKEIYCNNWYII